MYTSSIYLFENISQLLFPKLPWIIRQRKHKILLQHVGIAKILHIAFNGIGNAFVLPKEVQDRKFYLGPILFHKTIRKTGIPDGEVDGICATGYTSIVGNIAAPYQVFRKL